MEIVNSPDSEVPTQPAYVSQSGFVTVKVLRGFTEIAVLYDLLGEITQHRSFICGGYVRWMCSPTRKPHPATDVDIYSQNIDDFSALKQVLMNRFKLEIRHENDVSLTFKSVKGSDLEFCPTIQLIKPENKGAIVATGTMETVLSNFDFTVVRLGLTSPASALADADFIHDETKHLLRLKNIHCPISSTLRCMKYSSKGYWLKTIEAFKLFADWDSRNEEYRLKLFELIKKTEENNMSKEEIEELEALMRID